MVGAALGSIMPTIITAHISATSAKFTVASARAAAPGRSAASRKADRPSSTGMPIIRAATPSIASIRAARWNRNSQASRQSATRLAAMTSRSRLSSDSSALPGKARPQWMTPFGPICSMQKWA